MASTIAVSNETKSSSIRTTKDGRTIRYSLQVIQQPERARACGSGAKSSADRRPVDPPPIVELRVFENDNEITFAYNANFFLHASLENARTIAPGRPSTTPSFPVLTGTPVAGMAYLDRPTPAGYFIFPDLSVRHEGKYRLSFALFENLSEVKDLDPDDPDVIFDGNHFVTHRAEVKSAPFTVFSAKKFPGLSESTALSRMVAEQGCRVRIRRDVRMRRRENKGSKDWDDYEGEEGYDRARRTATPDNYSQPPNIPLNPDRPRSISNASAHSLAPPRRPSMDDMPQYSQPASNYQQQMAPPPTPGYSQMPAYGSTHQQYQSQYASPPSSSMMHPPQAPYSHQSQPVHNSYQNQPAMQMNQQYGYPNYQQQSHYEQPAPARQEAAPEYTHAPDYRRSSITQPPQQYPGPSQIISPYNSMDQYNRPQQMSQPLQPIQTSPHAHSVSSSMHTPSHHSLPTLKTLQPPTAMDKLEPVSPSYQSPPSAMSSGTMSAATMSANPESAYGLPRFAQGLPPVQTSAGQKRSFSSTFDTRHMNERLTGGARPNPSGAGYNYDECNSPDMEEPMDRAAMSYRRADGTQRQRHVPEVAAFCCTTCVPMLIPRERRNERPLAIYPPCSYSFILSCCSSMPTFVARLLFSLALLINACWVK
ncbi:hypothetical protein HBI31_129220 [Parastagonospora nodorum]|nr:hypothetical protein HBH67_028300 [Parastagonospora nodorum]KAH5109879.1 hypothetical protein HBH72_021770 [Parastagonospora nodorum]KAH5489973.1 hypothetical protein HBI31_129220 [Parastagonospora nodorum]